MAAALCSTAMLMMAFSCELCQRSAQLFDPMLLKRFCKGASYLCQCAAPETGSGVTTIGDAMTGDDDARKILAEARNVLVIDWPSRDVPATLAGAGFAVTVKGGPGPADYTAWETVDGEVVTRPLGRAPEHVDLVYCHRPIEELASILSLAQSLGAAVVWRQSGLAASGAKEPDGCWTPPGESEQGRDLAAAAGLGYIDDVYIADAVRALGQSA